MKKQIIIDFLKNHLRRIRSHDKIFFTEYKKEFRNFILFVVIAALITYFASNFFISKFINNITDIGSIVEPVKILVSILTGIVISSFYLPYYIYFVNKEAFSYFFRLRGDNLNNRFRSVVLKYFENNINNQLKILTKLTNYGEIKSDYTTQYQFAKMFSEIVHDYFWATSYDKPSEFPIRNIGYLQKFDCMNLIGRTDSGIPKKSRIFIITYKDLIKDIVENKDYLLQLFKMHLHYFNNEVICSIKFLLCKEENYQEVLDIVKIHFSDSSNFIFDYFIIDDKLIYGRKNKKLSNSNNEINISFLSKQFEYDSDKISEIANYKAVFNKLWESSNDIKSLTNLLKSDDVFINSTIENVASAQLISVEKIKDFIKRFIDDSNDYYDTIENTESTNIRYGSIFENSKFGNMFFNKWLGIIQNATDIGWAVDSSSRKEGDEFYKIWDSDKDEHKEYRLFFNASIECSTKNKCDFKRIFIVNKRIPSGDYAIFNRFLTKTVEENNMKVGVIVSQESSLSELEQLNQSDFLIINIKSKPGNNFDFKDAKGFTLRNESFKMEKLKYTENLIIEKDFNKYKEIFLKLWNNSNIIKFENKDDTTNSNKISQLIQ